MAEDGAVLSLSLPHRREAAASARKALTALNGSLHLVSETRLRDAQLLVAEVVANAVRHTPGDGGVALTVHATPDVMRVEVRDHGGGFDPHRLQQPSTDKGGRWGLWIVATLAHRWGVDRGRQTTVWFEIDRPQRDAPLPAEPTDPGDGLEAGESGPPGDVEVDEAHE